MNLATHNDSLPEIITINKYGTVKYQPKTEEEYKLYLREQEENHQKNDNVVGILMYSTIIMTCISVYTIYSLY
jgi:hypothetical protein